MSHLDSAAQYLRDSVETFRTAAQSDISADELASYAGVLRAALDNFRDVAAETTAVGDPFAAETDSSSGPIAHRVDERLTVEYYVRVDNRGRLVKSGRQVADAPDACVPMDVQTPAEALVAILSDAQVDISSRLADMGAVLSFDIKGSTGRHRISVVPPS